MRSSSERIRGLRHLRRPRKYQNWFPRTKARLERCGIDLRTIFQIYKSEMDGIKHGPLVIGPITASAAGLKERTRYSRQITLRYKGVGIKA
ncbi:hypothetical protein TSAR_016371 [Trichomalopsis sarcophagae]|uniref:Uncharacterized protein n=1 Tax=Trichomalopsis sarcophagae TaxID=543379 RepID=A0A232F1F2_9HYME|nr:hypothetical protein TSAR_016371 [Trichomalopsis sarcophagae]